MNALAQSETASAAALRAWALLLGICLLLAGNGLQGTLLGIVAEDEGFSSITTGIIMASYFAGFLLGSQASQTFISRVGHVRTFAALASLSSIAILIHGLMVDPVVWSAMRFVTGFSFAGLYVVAESWLNRETTTEHRGALLAIYMVVSHAGLAGGQALLNTAPASGLAIYVVASAILSVAVIPILLSTSPQPLVDLDAEQMRLSKVFRVTPLGTSGCFLAGVANGILLGMATVYARQIGFSIETISLFMAAIMIGGAAFQWPVGKLSDRMDRRLVILGVSVLATISCVGLGQAAGSQTLFILAGFTTGGLVLTLYPLFLSYANDWFDADQMVSASSGLVAVYGAGALFGPIGSGALMSALGPQGFVYYLFALLLFTVGFTGYRIAFTDPPETQDDFLYAPAALGVSDIWAETAAESAEEAEAEAQADAEAADA